MQIRKDWRQKVKSSQNRGDIRVSRLRKLSRRYIMKCNQLSGVVIHLSAYCNVIHQLPRIKWLRCKWVVYEPCALFRVTFQEQVSQEDISKSKNVRLHSVISPQIGWKEGMDLVNTVASGDIAVLVERRLLLQMIDCIHDSIVKVAWSEGSPIHPWHAGNYQTTHIWEVSKLLCEFYDFRFNQSF